ncbi:TPA: Rgg/GadR/MutR family transcriptional regulator, partial [Streptococcus agalactiae]|nr:Rgg/GadR/MutR family transcriptional regulator [Streptococcus agalactiae]HEO7128373.1 Rgg/GadR/MutR family transcriptional regulator [Streptococcus agalactiae]
GYYHLKLGDTSSGKEDMRKALQIFKYLGEDSFYNTYNEHYCQKVLGNNKEC